MGGGLSKKQKAARPQPQAPCAPPPQAPHGGRFDDSDGWEVAPGGLRDDGIPYALLCSDEGGFASPARTRARADSVPFDTPTGGAGVGSLRARHLDEPGRPAGAAELSELPPTSLFVELLEVGGLNDSVTPGKQSQTDLYCVAVVGTVTRVIDSKVSEGLDLVKLYSSRVVFPLHDRQEVQLIGLTMHLSVFLSSVVPTDSDREIGECSVELDRDWLLGTGGHTTWLRLLDGAGCGSACRIKVSIMPEFGRGTVQQQDESLLCSRGGSRLQDTLLDLSAVRARSASPAIASSDDDDTLLTDRSDLPFPPGAGLSSASSRKALISKAGLEALLEEVRSFNNHTQRVEWMRIVRAQHSFTCAQVIIPAHYETSSNILRCHRSAFPASMLCRKLMPNGALFRSCRSSTRCGTSTKWCMAAEYSPRASRIPSICTRSFRPCRLLTIELRSQSTCQRCSRKT